MLNVRRCCIELSNDERCCIGSPNFNARRCCIGFSNVERQTLLHRIS